MEINDGELHEISHKPQVVRTLVPSLCCLQPCKFFAEGNNEVASKKLTDRLNKYRIINNIMPHTCARHGGVSKTTKLCSFFLCDECASKLVNECFNGHLPVFEGYNVNGFCALCGNYKPVKLRQWFLCDNCERVVHSYPVGMAAQNYVLKWWNENIPEIRLEVTDPIVLSSYPSGKKKAKTTTNPDLTGFDAQGNKVLLIEIKTGRSAINEMSNFQLDISDCDDILEFVRRELVATYIFHVQVIEEFSPPTSYFKPVGIWWTDIFKMERSFQKIIKRRIDRGKQAVYFDPKCFETMTSFINEVKKEKYNDLTKKLRQGRIPILYKTTS
jgi:hypothetical protein